MCKKKIWEQIHGDIRLQTSSCDNSTNTKGRITDHNFCGKISSYLPRIVWAGRTKYQSGSLILNSLTPIGGHDHPLLDNLLC